MTVAAVLRSVAYVHKEYHWYAGYVCNTLNRKLSFCMRLLSLHKMQEKQECNAVANIRADVELGTMRPNQEADMHAYVIVYISFCTS